KPNVNSATVPYTEFDKLGGNYDQEGSIELGKVTLQGWRLIEVTASKMGKPRGQNTARVTEYHLYFSDKREDLVEPRGGRVRLGLINAGPDPQGAKSGEPATPPSGAPELQLFELIGECVK